jgi:hypothetical protein
VLPCASGQATLSNVLDSVLHSDATVHVIIKGKPNERTNDLGTVVLEPPLILFFPVKPLNAWLYGSSVSTARMDC